MKNKLRWDVVIYEDGKPGFWRQVRDAMIHVAADVGEMPHMIDVISGSDINALVVTDRKISAERAQVIYDQWLDEDARQEN